MRTKASTTDTTIRLTRIMRSDGYREIPTINLAMPYTRYTPREIRRIEARIIKRALKARNKNAK